MPDPYARREDPPPRHCTQVWTDEHGVWRKEFVRYDDERPFPEPDAQVEYDDEPLPDYEAS